MTFQTTQRKDSAAFKSTHEAAEFYLGKCESQKDRIHFAQVPKTLAKFTQ
jgi:hypothetical protein